MAKALNALPASELRVVHLGSVVCAAYQDGSQPIRAMSSYPLTRLRLTLRETPVWVAWRMQKVVWPIVI